MKNAELFSYWAIVTIGDSCEKHSHACPSAVWGPYTRREAEYLVTTISPDHHPHVVPFWVREGYRELPRREDPNCRDNPAEGATVMFLQQDSRRFRR